MGTFSLLQLHGQCIAKITIVVVFFSQQFLHVNLLLEYMWNCKKNSLNQGLQKG